MSKRPLHARILDFLGDLYKSLRFLFHHLQEKRRFGEYCFTYNTLHNGEAVNILANGPSLNIELNSLLASGKIVDDVLVVNYFLESELFVQIQPKYYCLADPGFNQKNKLIERTKNVFKALNERVSWPMTLFVWNSAVEMVSKYISNPNIKIIGLSILQFEGFENKRFKLYKEGKAAPSYVNVTIMAIYALLNLGYSKLYLYGVDHSFLTNLIVGDDNILYVEDNHFYGKERIIADYHTDGTPWKVSEFIYDKYLTFVEHEVMRGYADYLGAQIINCTKDSWIDAYVRTTQLEKQSEQN